jgi:NADPH-dependent 2,4-dienoyl-CoA reductase/sulfur reductase-like enzyme
MQIVVIGGTASGTAAAAEAARQAPDATVRLFEQAPHIAVGACEIPHFIAGEVPDADLLETLTPQAFSSSRGVGTDVETRVEQVDLGAGRLTVSGAGGERTEPFDRLILATGARARRLGLDGEDADGVFRVRTLEAAKSLYAYLDRHEVSTAAIAGGGYIGLEMADALRQRGIMPTILDPEGRVLARTLAPELYAPLGEALRKAGVQVRAAKVEEIETQAGAIRAVWTSVGERLPCDLLIVAVGVEVRTELAASIGVAVGGHGALEVDAQMRTAAENVWACGDAVAVKRVIDGQKVHWPLAPVGRKTAYVAAKNAAAGWAAGDAAFPGITGAIAVKAFGYEVAKVGLGLDEATEAGFDAACAQVEHWSRVSLLPGAERLCVRLIGEKGAGRLLGGQLIGREGAALRADVLVPLLVDGWSAERALDRLDLVYNPPIAPSRDPLLVAFSQLIKEL